MDTESIERELAEITLALSAITKGGQSYTISFGGGSRSVTMADYHKLIGRKKELTYQLQTLQGTTGMRIGPAW